MTRRLTILAVLLVIGLFAVIAYAQSLSPNQKAVLDFYYLEKQTNSIPGSYIIDGTITGDKLTNGAVTTAKIADGAVTSEKISDGTISNIDVAANADIAPTKILNEALTKTTVFGGEVSGVWDSLVVAGKPAGGLHFEGSYILTWGAGTTNYQGYRIVTNWHANPANIELGATTHSNIIATVPGYYDVFISMSHAGAGGGEEYEMAVFTNGWECDLIEAQRKTSFADVGNMSAGNIIHIATNTVVDLRIKAVDGSASQVTPRKMQLKLNMVRR